jgi:hypothetical protein
VRDPFNGQVNVLYLRFVELFAYFAIVLVARILGGFTYRAEALLGVFLLAVFFQYNAEWLWEWWGRRRQWQEWRVKSAILWYSCYVDLAVVLSLIYLTGTIESPFLLLIAVPLFFVGNIFAWKTTAKFYLTAALFSIASLAILEMLGVVPHNVCYSFEPQVYLNGHYLAGSLLVIGAIIALVLFLSTAFQDRLNVTMERLRRKDRESEIKIHELSRLYDISLGINSAISVGEHSIVQRQAGNHAFGLRGVEQCAGSKTRQEDPSRRSDRVDMDPQRSRRGGGHQSGQTSRLQRPDGQVRHPLHYRLPSHHGQSRHGRCIRRRLRLPRVHRKPHTASDDVECPARHGDRAQQAARVAGT